MRLDGYDYSRDGYYFVTVCTWGHSMWLGDIRDDKMILNQFGEIVKYCWFDLPNHYRNCILDKFVIMPNHIHGILIINNDVGAGLKPARTYPIKRHSLSEIIRGFKTFSSRKINKKNSIIHFQ